ncbi:hypothetical protein H4582DRAFT_2121044 [Lactarius indigo]|nr:hypothetical protein H4582DRAFT_1862639 [Lactarius indigo]KAI9430352.1 hypothetical protein H4582DRAFT_1860440 [Lactarius indigo]KAI9433666.1 hypothetical protein H4582DRAFT_2121044 [Lactarius indigo]
MSSDLENGDEDYIEDTEEIDPTVFHIWDPLQKPATLQYTTEQLHTMIHEGDVDLDPEYQRAVVWSSSKQMAIIDSLFHNYYIPPVVFAISKDPVDGAVTRLCVDGKQRLTSIQKFFDGQIAYRCPRTKKQWWYTTSTATRGSRSEIPASQKRVFAQKLITCIEYHHLSPAAEREVFQRVQLGMSLTSAEKLQAISSPWANYVTHLEKTHVTIDGGLVDMIAFDDTRGRAFQNIAQLVYCCAGLPAAQRIPSAAKLEKWLTAPDERPSAAFRDAMGDVLDRLWELARSSEHDAPFRRFRAKVSPVEFVFIGVLLYTMRHGYTAAEQSRAAFVLRRDIRKAHVDVRFNARVAADCWRLIDSIENGEIDIEPPMASELPSSTTPGVNRRKRKSYDYTQPPAARLQRTRGKKTRDVY